MFKIPIQRRCNVCGQMFVTQMATHTCPNCAGIIAQAKYEDYRMRQAETEMRRQAWVEHLEHAGDGWVVPSSNVKRNIRLPTERLAKVATLNMRPMGVRIGGHIQPLGGFNTGGGKRRRRRR